LQGIGAHNGRDLRGNGWIWEFGTKIGVEMRFEKQPVGTCQLFRQINHRLGHLELVWNQFSLLNVGYLGIWTKA
jgi:hypothetical protein